MIDFLLMRFVFSVANLPNSQRRIVFTATERRGYNVLRRGYNSYRTYDPAS